MRVSVMGLVVMMWVVVVVMMVMRRVSREVVISLADRACRDFLLAQEEKRVRRLSMQVCAGRRLHLNFLPADFRERREVVMVERRRRRPDRDRRGDWSRYCLPLVPLDLPRKGPLNAAIVL
uniref:Putative secreted protein n=1 Tax=Ixodes ricinus TaxID=34613 RepID=A0A6B0UNC7_IXORI